MTGRPMEYTTLWAMENNQIDDDRDDGANQRPRTVTCQGHFDIHHFHVDTIPLGLNDNLQSRTHPTHNQT